MGHGQELSLSLIEVRFAVRDESEPSRRHMQLLRIYEVCQLIDRYGWHHPSFISMDFSRVLVMVDLTP